MQYSSTTDETVYRANDLSLGTMFPTGGLSRDPSVALRSWAQCTGQGCQPEQIWFSFVIRGSSSPSSTTVLSNRDVVIRADETVHDWPEQRRGAGSGVQTGGTTLEVPGTSGSELTRISMNLATLRDIAEADRVSGTLGDEDFSLSYDDRAPLRAFVEKVTSPDAGTAQQPAPGNG